MPQAAAAEEGGEGANGDPRETVNGEDDEGEKERTWDADADADVDVGDGSGRGDPWTMDGIWRVRDRSFHCVTSTTFLPLGIWQAFGIGVLQVRSPIAFGKGTFFEMKRQWGRRVL